VTCGVCYGDGRLDADFAGRGQRGVDQGGGGLSVDRRVGMDLVLITFLSLRDEPPCVAEFER